MHILDKSSLSDMYILQVFSSNLWLAIHFLVCFDEEEFLIFIKYFFVISAVYCLQSICLLSDCKNTLLKFSSKGSIILAFSFLFFLPE